jgi:hypothetical protein
MWVAVGFMCAHWESQVHPQRTTDIGDARATPCIQSRGDAAIKRCMAAVGHMDIILRDQALPIECTQHSGFGLTDGPDAAVPVRSGFTSAIASDQCHKSPCL